MEYWLVIESVLGPAIHLDRKYWAHLIRKKHPSLSGKKSLVQRAVEDPDFVRKSHTDPAVFLYYLAYNAYWLCVVCKHENGRGFFVTAYVTDRIKRGEEVWRR